MGTPFRINLSGANPISVNFGNDSPFGVVIPLFNPELGNQPVGGSGSNVSELVGPTDPVNLTVVLQAWDLINNKLTLYNHSDGTGVEGTSNNEITNNNFVQLDLSNLQQNLKFPTTIYVTVSGLEEGDEFLFYSSASPGVLGTPLPIDYTFIDDASVIVPLKLDLNMQRYLSLTAESGGVLLTKITLSESAVKGFSAPHIILMFGEGIAPAAIQGEFEGQLGYFAGPPPQLLRWNGSSWN